MNDERHIMVGGINGESLLAVWHGLRCASHDCNPDDSAAAMPSRSSHRMRTKAAGRGL
jgi:hypothetical protein